MSNRRVSIPVSEKLYQRFTNSLQWGERTNVMVILIEQLCDIMEREGAEGMAKIYLGKIRLGETNEELSSDDITRAVGRAFKHTKAQDRTEE